MTDFTQVLVAKASIYALNNNKWEERGQGGNLMLYYYNSNRGDMLCRWWKNTNSLAYQLVPGKLKPKGERSWVLRALNMGFSPPHEEVLAIRFAEKQPSETFRIHYEETSKYVSLQKQQQQNYNQYQQPNNQNQYQQLQNYYQQQQQQQQHQPQQQQQYQQFQPRKQPNYEQNNYQQNYNQNGNYNNQNQNQHNQFQPNKQPNNYSNQRNDQDSKMINQQNPFAKWVCSICTYQNILQKSHCEMCGKKRENNVKIVDDRDQHINGFNLHDMQNYKSIRGFGSLPDDNRSLSDNNQQNENPDSWNCPACTYTNPLVSDKCGICNTKRVDKKNNEEDDYSGFPIREFFRKQEEQKKRNSMNGSNQNFNNNNNHNNNGNQNNNGYDGEEQQRQQYEQYQKYQQQHQQRKQEQQNKPGEWQCSICTLKNPFNSRSCQVCGTPKSKMGYGMGYIQHDDDNGSINSSYKQEVQNNRMINDRSGYGNPYNHEEDNMRRDNSSKSLFDPYQQGKSNSKVPNSFVTEYQKVQKLVTKKKSQSTEQDFSRASSDIACYNDDPSPVFSTLRSVAKKLLKDEVKYRTLDTTNPKVMERLIGYEGVLDFLMLLGFEADSMGQKLVCHDKPPKEVVRNAIQVLDKFEHKFGRFKRNKSKNKDNNGDDYKQNKNGNNNEVEDDDDNMTLQQIVLWCTHENMRDNETMETLIMCHKEFSTSLVLIQELKKRFFVNIPQNIQNDKQKVEEFAHKTMKPIQLNVIKNLRNWMKQYWVDDFKKDEKVQQEIEDWIKKMCENAKLYSWNGLLADTVRNEFKRYKKYGISKKVENVDYSGVKIPKKFNINSLSPNELADQITVMDYTIFSKIKPRECLGQAWKKKDNKVRAPNILAMIEQFNHLTTFVQIQILREKSLKDRGRAMKRIIKMGEHFREIKNYNSLCAVFSALNSAPIHRLKYAWERVPQKQKAMFDQFKVIFASGHNHRNLRQLFRNAAAPSIPHIGIFLQDLVFIDDGHENQRNELNLQRKMVNFSKSVRMADRIKNIQMYQQHPYNNIKVKEVVQKILRDEFHKLSDITEDTIWDMSTEIKKQDERDKNRYF